MKLGVIQIVLGVVIAFLCSVLFMLLVTKDTVVVVDKNQSSETTNTSLNSADSPLPKVLAAQTSGEVPLLQEESTPVFVVQNDSEPVSVSISQPSLEEIRREFDERLLIYLSVIARVLAGIDSTKSATPAVTKIINNNHYSYANTEEIASFTNLATNALIFTDSNNDLAASVNLSVVGNNVGIGTSSPSELLAVAGPVYFDSIIPTATTNRLYNTDGDLYWDGNIISSSSASTPWSLGSGNAYRLTGNVGIGTSTPSDTLTVSGTVSAGTTTARILDTGGAVCNVDAYGAIGDNSTDNYTAIMNTIAACPEGGIVYFPMGEYRISQTIVLDKPVTLRGAYAPRWSYSSTPRSSIRAAFGSFVGSSIIHVRDKSISGEATDNNGGRIENLTIDGGSWGSNIIGVYFEGLVRDWKLTDVDITQTSGNGFESAVGTGSGNPRGFTIRGLSIYSAGGHGFRATALNDSYIEDLLTVGNALRGIYISSMGETKINNSRAVFNALEGLYIDGSSNNGGLMFTDFSTDRNDRHGVRISLTGTTTVTFNGLLTRRDGANVGGGSETPYAGVAVIGTSTEQVAPVFINGLSQIVGYDDSNNPPVAPLTGVRVTNASYVKVGGQLWGVNEAYRDDGGNDNFIIEEDSVIKTGIDLVTETPPTLYSNKWIASTTKKALSYDGQINIGSSTSNRLLNIVAPSNAGARFLDTTNGVTFDMRAEDYQGFFGTFSNHQLRFQTNNTSRLTIDTDGDIGIGTTSPSAQLHTTGSMRLEGLSGGSLITDANGNVSVSSDERLKDIEGFYSAGLDEVLDLKPILYHWNATSGYDTKTLYAGFSAQNVQLVLPEAVGRNKDGFLTLSDRPILAAVVTAIRELWDMITGNTEKISELENRIEHLETLLEVEQKTQPDQETDNKNPEPGETKQNNEESVASTTQPITNDSEKNASSTNETSKEIVSSIKPEDEQTEDEWVVEVAEDPEELEEEGVESTETKEVSETEPVE